MNACKRVVKIEYKCTSRRWENCDFDRDEESEIAYRHFGFCDWNNNGMCKHPKAIRDAAARAIMEDEE